MTTIDKTFDFQEKVLALRGYRQQLLASNIANADTPNYKAVDIDFAKALQMAQSGRAAGGLAKTSPMHLDAAGGSAVAGVKPLYRAAVQPSIDGNTVDTNVEQSQFSENALQYMATLQFINGKIQSTMLALRGGN
ncbi:MAG TPA: flagellar basal body rod protein FlgB [Novimethylophilus sp.]|uniref:flagellar basal body rod protein FlgB n=1 Tax=Novimethylophilus sp. TaxID=2137426 RepID=UPI002F42CD23